jgi:CRP-like cAMP-binding protein
MRLATQFEDRAFDIGTGLSDSTPRAGLGCSPRRHHQEFPVSKSDVSAPAGANRFLAALPPDEYEHLAPRLEAVPLPVKAQVLTPGEPVSYVYFPLRGVLSMTALMLDGAQVEVGMVGNEGAVGMYEALAGVPAVNRCFCQLEGEAIRIAASDFTAAFDRGAALRRLVHRFQHALAMQVSQTAACNRLHQVESRLARWLLMSRDRVESDELPLTHEFLSIMLATPRPVVTRAVGALTSEGAINHGRGSVTILDRAGLEALCCECYEIVSGLYGGIYDGAGG